MIVDFPLASVDGCVLTLPIFSDILSRFADREAQTILPYPGTLSVITLTIFNVICNLV